MIPVKPISPSPLERYFTQQKTGNTLTNAVSTAGKELPKATNFLTNLFISISGLVLTTISGAAKSLFPEGTFVDRFALFGIFIGAITSIFGGIRLYKGYSQGTSDKTVNPRSVKISDQLSKDIAETLGNLSVESNNDFKLAKKVLEGTKDDKVRKAVIELLKLYRTRHKDGDFIIQLLQDTDEFCFKNGGGNDTTLLTSELKDRIALLISYIVGTADKVDGKITDPDAKTILETDLNLKDLESGANQELAHLLLPPEFTCVYQAARNYKSNHLGKNLSIKEIITLDKTLKDNLTSTVIDNQELAEGQLNKFVDQYNYLKALKEAINFVNKIEGTNNTDKKLVRKAFIIKSALIAGLELDTREPKVSIDHQLKVILSDGDIGLNKKIEEVEKSLEEIKNIFQESSLKYSFGNPTFTFTEIFSSTTGLISLQRQES